MCPKIKHSEFDQNTDNGAYDGYNVSCVRGVHEEGHFIPAVDMSARRMFLTLVRIKNIFSGANWKQCC